MPAFSKPIHPPSISQHTTEFFNNANNTVIHDSSLSVHNSSARKDGFQILQEHVAPAAFHNSKQRVDPPRCHPHTREAVLDEIFDWILGNIPRKKWIAWLNGAAGSGKSAICQSIAERCIERGILIASFFFFRADSTRNAIDPLVATLAYQIVQLVPEMKRHIVEAIESHPLVFEQTFEAQLDLLVVRPLSLLQISEPAWKLLLMIDGMDECKGSNTQMTIIRTIANILLSKDLPIIVLFSSRRENQLIMAFNPPDIGGILNQLPLDDNYHADEDILRFLNDGFALLKQIHPFGKTLGDEWPLPKHVQEIVTKSSGQFMYASVVIHFLSDPSSNPSIRLDIIRGLRPMGRLTPFAQLDELYCYIFSQVDDIAITLDVLAYMIFGEAFNVKKILHFFKIQLVDIQSILAPLSPILLCNLDENKITFRHASLPDFLRDKERSKEYCINGLATPLCTHWFAAAESGHFRELQMMEQNIDIVYLLKHAEITEELYASLILYTPSQHHSAYELPRFAACLLTAIHYVDFGDGGKAYANMLSNVVRYVKKESPDDIKYIEEEHDISQILGQIASERDISLLTMSESDTKFQDGAPPIEATSATGLLPSLMDMHKPIGPPISASVDPVGILEEISTIINADRIAGVNTSSSQESLLEQPSFPSQKTWQHAFKTWFLKLDCGILKRS